MGQKCLKLNKNRLKLPWVSPDVTDSAIHFGLYDQMLHLLCFLLNFRAKRLVLLSSILICLCVYLGLEGSQRSGALSAKCFKLDGNFRAIPGDDSRTNRCAYFPKSVCKFSSVFVKKGTLAVLFLRYGQAKE